MLKAKLTKDRPLSSMEFEIHTGRSHVKEKILKTQNFILKEDTIGKKSDKTAFKGDIIPN